MSWGLALGQRKPKKLTDWARQMLLLVRRWLPERELIVVADSGFAVLEMLACWQKERPLYKAITAITIPGWYRTNKGRPAGHTGQAERTVEVASGTAVWSNTGKALVPIRWVLIRDPLGQFTPQALLCTDCELEPVAIVSYFVQRWQVEVTFHEVREHLGVETQRQWSDQAIERTTPLLFALVTLLAHHTSTAHSKRRRHFWERHCAWYTKDNPTFSDALAWVRRALWLHQQPTFLTSPPTTPLSKPQLLFLQHITDLLAYAP